MTKTCSKCQKLKIITDFHRYARSSDGYKAHCKICEKQYKDGKKQITSEYSKEYRTVNAVKIKKYFNENRQILLEKMRKYRKENLHLSRRSCAKYKANKLKATPSWLSVEDLLNINQLYEFTSILQKLTGVKYHIDHIIPLQGKTVCGLHVPWNLQILRAEINISKSNKL